MSRAPSFSASSKSSKASRIDVRIVGPNEFDVWKLVRRTNNEPVYCMTARYRQCKGLLPRKESNIIVRKRKDTHTDDGDGESIVSSNGSTTNSEEGGDSYMDDDDTYQPPQDTHRTVQYKLEKRSYGTISRAVSADVIQEISDNGSEIQKFYLKRCKILKTAPSAFFARSLDGGDLGPDVVMEHYSFGPTALKPCTDTLAQSSTVKVLNLNDNGLGVEGAKLVGQLLKAKQNITDLSIANNDIGLEGATPILEAIKEFDHIIQLDISGNGFKESDAQAFKEVIEDTRRLKVLNLSHNEFREIGGELLGESLAINDTLTELDLSWNHLRRSGAVGIADGLQDNITLKKLNVAWNGFYLEGCMALAEALEFNETVRELNLNSNRLTRECLQALMGGLSSNQSLRILRLAANPLTSAGAYDMLSFIDETPSSQIKVLDFGTQVVELAFIKLLAKIKGQREIDVIHGVTYGQKLDANDEVEKGLLDENPALILVEYGKLMGFRLMDLFSAFDKDGSKSLDRDEIKRGLKLADIPLKDKSIDILIEKLDANGDGEIDFGELITAQNLYKEEMRKYYQAQEGFGDLRVEETDIFRIKMKLRNLMAPKWKDVPTFKRQSDMLKKQIEEMKAAREAQQPRVRLSSFSKKLSLQARPGSPKPRPSSPHARPMSPLVRSNSPLAPPKTLSRPGSPLPHLRSRPTSPVLMDTADKRQLLVKAQTQGSFLSIPALNPKSDIRIQRHVSVDDQLITTSYIHEPTISNIQGMPTINIENA